PRAAWLARQHPQGAPGPPPRRSTGRTPSASPGRGGHGWSAAPTRQVRRGPGHGSVSQRWHPGQGSALHRKSHVNRLCVNLGKYLLAIGLLAWVVCSNWAPPPTRAVAALGASTLGLCASPGGSGPLLAIAAATPGRAEARGLGYVWRRHVLEGVPAHAGFL